jgi:hypothetical protein
MLLVSLLACAPFAAQTPIDATKVPGFELQPSQVTTSMMGRATSACDDFNRPDSPNMGPDWAELAGDIDVYAMQGLGILPMSLMTHTGVTDLYSTSTISSRFDHGGGLVYVAMVAGFNTLNDNIFVKVQDNDSDGMYDRVFFYYGNNGSPWGVATYYFDLATPTVSGYMTLSFDVTGDVAKLEIQNDASGLLENFSVSGVLAVAPSLGMEFGVGTYGPAFFDNLSINDGCGTGFTYTLTQPVGGQSTTLSVVNATPSAGIIFGYSLTGPGPTMTPFGPCDMSPPITQLPLVLADWTGAANLTVAVPLRATGRMVYTQAADVVANALSNSHAVVVL